MFNQDKKKKKNEVNSFKLAGKFLDLNYEKHKDNRRGFAVTVVLNFLNYLEEKGFEICKKK